MSKVINVLCFVLILNFDRTNGILKLKDIEGNDSEPLILTPFIREGRLIEARSAASVVLKGTGNISSYSGYLTVDEKNNSNLFFWFFESMKNANRDPIILWLQSGLSSSCLTGLFIENGPFWVTTDNVLVDREYTWIRNHSVIYMDNVVGNGFSFTNEGYPTNVDQIAEHLYKAMLQFFQLFPHFQKNDFFIAGKNYCGKIIPALGHLISINNSTALLKINLKGMVMGEPFSDPINQCMMGHYLYEHGMIDYMQLEQFLDAENEISHLINNGQHRAAFDVLQTLHNFFMEFTNLDGYENDILHGLEKVEYMIGYLNFIDQAEVRKAIHVGGTTFSGGKAIPYLLDDYTQSVAPYIDFLLPKYRMLLYSGQLTPFVNFYSVNNFLQNLNYMENRNYSNITINNWVAQGEMAGYKIVAGNLINILVGNVGRVMSDMSLGFAYDMIFRFTRDQL